MSGVKNASLFSPSPDDFVNAVLKKVGASKRCFGYWPHELQAFIFGLVPVEIKSKLILKFVSAVREKALKKKKAKKES